MPLAREVRKLSSTAIRGVLLLMLALCAAALLPRQAAADDSILLDRVVAVVNKEVITWSELYAAMDSEFGKALSAMSDKDRLAFLKSREGVYLDAMINNRLQMQSAKKLGITPAEDEIDEAIDGIRKKNNLTPGQFESELKDAGYTKDTYRKSITEQMTISRLVDREVRRNVKVTDEDVKDYLKASNLPADGKFYHITQAYFKLPTEDNVEETKQKIAKFMAEANGGANFRELSAKYSESAIAENGGDMGYIHESKLSDEFKHAVQDLKPGDVSRPFQSSMGVHIIKLEDVRTARQMLEAERFSAAYRDWLRALREDALVEVRL